MGAPVEAMLYLSDPPALESLHQFDDFLLKRANGEDRLKEFINHLRDFAVETDFMSFYKNNQDIYDEHLLPVKRVSRKFRHIELLEDYYGLRQSSYNIIMAPLSRASYGLHLNKGEEKDLYSVCGIASFGNEGEIDIDKFIYLVWHEFSHPFINPITERNNELADKYFYRFKDIQAHVMKSGYGRDWHECVNEHIIRAVNARFAELEFGKKKGQQMLRQELDQGFILVADLCESLKIYENKRDIYPNIEMYYSELLRIFT